MATRAPLLEGSTFARTGSLTLLFLAGFLAAITALSILLLDPLIANWLHAWGIERLAFFDQGTSVLDTVTGKELSKFLIGSLVLVTGLLLSARKRTRIPGLVAAYVGSVQLLATLIVGVSKNAFGRLRPYETLQGDALIDMWQAGGSSFPSGHTAFYFGLFLPLAYLFPKWRWPLLVVPVFIGLARINANDHFLSDVTASITLVVVLSWLGALWLRKRVVATGIPAPALEQAPRST